MQNKENYRQLGILNGFSEDYERFINDGMFPIIQNFHQTLFQLTENIRVQTMY